MAKFSDKLCPKCGNKLLCYCEVTRFPSHITHLYCIECDTLYSVHDDKLHSLVPTIVKYADLENIIKCWRAKVEAKYGS